MTLVLTSTGKFTTLKLVWPFDRDIVRTHMTVSDIYNIFGSMHSTLLRVHMESFPFLIGQPLLPRILAE